jgi:hypothetical protein
MAPPPCPHSLKASQTISVTSRMTPYHCDGDPIDHCLRSLLLGVAAQIGLIKAGDERCRRFRQLHTSNSPYP